MHKVLTAYYIAFFITFNEAYGTSCFPTKKVANKFVNAEYNEFQNAQKRKNLCNRREIVHKIKIIYY